MKIQLLCLSLVSAIWAIQIAGAAAEESDAAKPWAVGTAWSTDKSEILYREIHFAEDPEHDLTTRVEYRTPDDEVFAEKEIDYSVSTTAPAISQIDFRNDARIITRHPNATPGPVVELEVRPHDSDEIRTDEFDYEDGMIIDAGFDPFVRENWDRLASGRRVTTDFLVPARMDTVHISISKTDNDDCNIDAQNMHCFVIRPAGLLRMVSWFVDPIHIAYDTESRRLLMFDGISNLRDDAGEPRNALIQFEYF